MLGCQDFCGYYDWTFRHVQEAYGDSAVHRLWAEAITEAQCHYVEAGRARGLRGLYDTWVDTGNAEHCDWTFTLDDRRNVLRWDMRRCPSKGFLIDHELNACEDYCDHCMGWISPMLDRIGATVAAHEHNHCGQCWAEIRVQGRPYRSLSGKSDAITNDPRWQHGYIDHWQDGVKQPPHDAGNDQSLDVMQSCFEDADCVTVLGDDTDTTDAWTRTHRTTHVIATDVAYVTARESEALPRVVVIGYDEDVLKRLADRFTGTPDADRPVLMHPYLPGSPWLTFDRYGLPRPSPMLPALIRHGVYTHEPFAPAPSTGVFALLLAATLGKCVMVCGIEAGRSADGVKPHHHMDTLKNTNTTRIAHLRAACDACERGVTMHPRLAQLIAATRPLAIKV